MTAKNHSQRLKRMTQRTPEQVARALFSAGQIIELHAQRSITQGSVSGAGHVPSAPGSPPNNDSGVLAGNIETRIGGENLVVVESNAPYSAYLEYGTSRMAARPFMRPAAEANKDEVVRLVGRAVNITIR